MPYNAMAHIVKKNTNTHSRVVDHVFSQGYITPSQASLSN